MSTCEKCWRDAHGEAERYGELIDARRDRPCTPEQQAGEDAGECPVCHRRTLHQFTGECMNDPRHTPNWQKPTPQGDAMSEPNLAAFGRYLRECMRSDCVSCAEVARRIGCDKSYLTLLRQGKREPSVSTLLDLENAIVGFGAASAVIYMQGKERAA